MSQSSDDAEQQSDQSVSIVSTGLQNNAANEFMGIRFQSVAIPAGASILGATLALTLQNDKNDPEGSWYCQDADNAGTFTTSTNDVGARPATAATVAWTTNDLGANETYINTPNLAACIQEVVDRAGWAENNSLVFIYAHTSAADAIEFASFDSVTNREPQLFVEWVLGVGAGATNAPAGLAACTGAADQAEVTVAPNTAITSSAGTANTAAVTVASEPGTADSTGAANTPIPSVGALAGVATVTGTADQPEATIGAKPNTPEATGVANQATVQTAAFTNAPAGLAAATGTAGQPEITISPNAGVGLAAGVASQPACLVVPKPGGPTATGTAPQPTVSITALAFPGVATGTGLAFAATADLDIKAAPAIAVGGAFPVFGLSGNPLGAGYSLLVDDDDDAVTVSDHDTISVTEAGQGLTYLENQDALEVSS